MNFTIPLKTKSGNVGHGREHWGTRARRVRKEREATAWAWIAAGLKLRRPKLPCVVTLTRIDPRALDGDNAEAALKAVRDQVAHELTVDDSDPRVSWRYAQERGNPKEYTVRVSIESAEPECLRDGLV